MKITYYMKGLYGYYCFSWLFALTIAQSVDPSLPFRAVNLGGWLVVEGWMTPHLFNDIPNDNLLDGTQVQFRSTMLNKFICPENGGGSTLVANRPDASGWETFRLWRIDESSFNFRVFLKQFIGLDNQGSKMIAVSNTPSAPETFQIVKQDTNSNRVRIKAPNGLFLQARTESAVTADYEGSLEWGDENPSVFEMKIIKASPLKGEFQLTNGHGPNKATQVMRDHWNSYVVEDDFRFMSEKGLHEVRIPVGWWIRFGQTPPKPFVGGSLQALDNAFRWAQKYNMKVIIDLHAVPGSQNGNDHSATRDGYQEWGSSNIDETVSIIDFLAERYANRPSLAAIELLNEPLAPGVTFDDLTNYYKAGYGAVRKYTSSAYVILSNRLGQPVSNTELLQLASGLERSVIDVHYYNLFTDEFTNMSLQQNIDYIHNVRSQRLQEVTPSSGPLSFVGEWSAALAIQGTPNDFQSFAKAQIEVYGKATFGWAYWSYKCGDDVNNPWSLKWLLENSYVDL